jgi:DNA primase
MNCPFCHEAGKGADTKAHLYINLQNGLYFCQRCQAKGRFQSEIDEFSLYQNPSFKFDYDKLKQRAKNLFTYSSSPSLIDLNEISWPVTDETPFAKAYLEERNFTPKDIETYNIRVGKPFYDTRIKNENNKWSGRILFPYFLNGACLYVVGRSYNDKDPKYLNSSGPKGLVVYGLDQVQGECIICEGIISRHTAARVTGKSTVCTLGKTMSRLQMALIRSKCKKVWVSYDADLTDYERRSTVKRLLKTGFEVWEVLIPLTMVGDKKLKDPDDYKEEYLQFFNEAKRVYI